MIQPNTSPPIKSEEIDVLSSKQTIAFMRGSSTLAPSRLARLVIPPSRESRQDNLAVRLRIAADLCLLPRLLELRELAHVRHPVSLPLKFILRVARALQHRRLSHGVEHEVILRARKVQQAQPIDVALVLGRQRHAVHCALDVVARQEAERVACVDRERAIERLGPLPAARGVVLDLQRGDRLAEEESDGAKVRVARRPEPVGELLLLGR